MRRITGRQLGRALLYPNRWLLLLLVPLCCVALIYVFVIETVEPVTYAVYALSAYTLTAVCFRIPAILAALRRLRRENRYIRRWFEDARLRVNVSLAGALLWNVGYAVLQLGLGIYHRSPWFYSLAAYYLLLSLMRAYLVRHSLRHAPGERLRGEWRRFRDCGWVFLVMNLALSVMMFYTVALDRAVEHHEITTIALAAYTFFTLTRAIVSSVKYRRYHSPLFSAAKAISLAAASVSMMSLESTMLVTFQDGTMGAEARRLFLALTGAAVTAVIVTMAIYMILQGSRALATLCERQESEEPYDDGKG